MPKTVLVIEDDPSVLLLLGDVLDLAGYHAEMALDGPEGLDCAKRTHPDLVLLDLTLPTAGGLEVARQVRAHPGSKAIPIVLMSGRDPTDEEITLADAFIAKPFRLDDVIDTVKRCIAT